MVLAGFHTKGAEVADMFGPQLQFTNQQVNEGKGYAQDPTDATRTVLRKQRNDYDDGGLNSKLFTVIEDFIDEPMLPHEIRQTLQTFYPTLQNVDQLTANMLTHAAEMALLYKKASMLQLQEENKMRKNQLQTQITSFRTDFQNALTRLERTGTLTNTQIENFLQELNNHIEYNHGENTSLHTPPYIPTQHNRSVGIGNVHPRYQDLNDITRLLSGPQGTPAIRFSDNRRSLPANPIQQNPHYAVWSRIPRGMNNAFRTPAYTLVPLPKGLDRWIDQ
eukprot:3934557-Rhodomonas_salina.1